jgi:hypothetical protein
MSAMTSSHAIVGSALTIAAMNILVAAIVTFTSPEARIEPQMLNSSAPLFQLSPIPAGADWTRH